MYQSWGLHPYIGSSILSAISFHKELSARGNGEPDSLLVLARNQG